MKILFVEDNPNHAFLLNHLLRNLGYQDVTGVSKSQEALSSLAHEDYDLVITDWMMPRMDGLSLVKEIRANEHGRHTPILMLTVRTEEEARTQALHSGADDYAIKPLRRDDLKTKIERLTQRPFQRPETLAPEAV